ncbi:AfsR/SARP family transcriptional regulator [Solwaraspora sp. WMMB335]|uniref:AfsR/SARP family transcriptional regulator n=1 Tax=Solwaraspora sp. WMMB335 TaxID=3404118 RepID=UPI003B92D052
MEFQVLGPVQVRVGGEPIDLGDRKQRLVLAVLLLEPNRLILLARLVDLLWPAGPPSSARRIVQAHLSRLRTTLSRHAPRPAAPTVTRRGPGYMLTCDPDSIDVYRFRLLVNKARDSDDGRNKVDLLRQALELWRGPALADVASEEIREELCRGLDEARLAAIEERFGAELRLGRHGQLIDELTELVARYPFRQQFAAFLMLALYRAGRAAEALTVYARTRQRLDAELGLEPSADLQRMQVSILRADPSLALRADPATALRSDPSLALRAGQPAG